VLVLMMVVNDEVTVEMASHGVICVPSFMKGHTIRPYTETNKPRHH
jgi:hypothetical protein